MNSRMKKVHLPLSMVFTILIVWACSTEKNTLLNREFHSLNAHYNGYFNANELISQSMSGYLINRQEDYHNLISLSPVPDENEVIGMYPAIDTAIAKCKKVITDHSMPNNDRPYLKKEEHNRWIDENWLTIGIASYYRRDYSAALKSFEFVKKFYGNDPSLYIGELWTAKTHLAEGRLTKAKFSLDNLDKALESAEGGGEKEKKAGGIKSKSKSKSKSKKKDKKSEKKAEFPKKIRFEFEKTKAELALVKEDKEACIKYLEEALKHAKRTDDKSRVHFVLAQLYTEKGNPQEASKHYTKVIKGKTAYHMVFNARLKRAVLGGEKPKKELLKMLKDAKNAEFKDQIYYALAEIELKDGNEQKGMEHLTNSAFYASKNARQKGMAYERLGDITFAKRDYVRAQKYYDSCGQVIPDTYPNADGIRAKAANLASLVVAVERANYEDSVQRIAAMSESEREDFLKSLIKKIKEEEAERKRKDAERLRELQENQSLFIQTGSGSKWYWNNAKMREDGLREFKRMWGNRENEDDWRRSEKTSSSEFSNTEIDSTEIDTLDIAEKDTLTIANLLRWIPLTDSTLALSNKRLIEANYNAGVIYKDQLNESKMAIERFDAVLAKRIEDDHNLLSAYQLYKLYAEQDPSKAAAQKQFILDNYPNSDYANFLRDPDYFVKKKEMDALAEEEYVRVLDRYERGLYYPVITKADQVIKEELQNPYRAKYLLLKALCLGRLSDSKSDMLPYLEQTIAEYAGSPEAIRAQEMIDILKNGYSENAPVDFEKKSPFTYEERVKMKVLVFPDEKLSSAASKTRVSDFNREFFSRDNLKVNSKIFGEKSSVIVVDDFATEAAASEYIRVYKRTRKHLLDMQDAKILMITAENLKVLFQLQNLEEYERFYEENY